MSDNPLCLAGFAATLAELWNRELPRNAAEDSFSFLPELQGRDSNHPNFSIVHQSYGGGLAITARGWKYVPEDKPRKGEVEKPAGHLFNLVGDPYEKNNLYAEHPERLQALKDLLQKIQDQGHSRL